MLIVRIKEFLSSFDERSPSLVEAQEIIDFGLDIMNEVNGVEEFIRFRNFDLRLSMSNFSYLIKEDNEDNEIGYWNDSIDALKFDLKRFIRTLDA
jgi:hypothetical protein